MIVSLMRRTWGIHAIVLVLVLGGLLTALTLTNGSDRTGVALVMAFVWVPVAVVYSAVSTIMLLLLRPGRLAVALAHVVALGVVASPLLVPPDVATVVVPAVEAASPQPASISQRIVVRPCMPGRLGHARPRAQAAAGPQDPYTSRTSRSLATVPMASAPMRLNDASSTS